MLLIFVAGLVVKNFVPAKWLLLRLTLLLLDIQTVWKSHPRQVWSYTEEVIFSALVELFRPFCA